MLDRMIDAGFYPAVRRWFDGAFAAPTPVQCKAWAAIAGRQHTLIAAPTGSGKTLAGFLAVIDDLVEQSLNGGLADETQVLYVSPLKALSNDIHKNLEVPLDGIRRELAAEMAGDAPIRVAVRTGDTPQSERARMRRVPPHVLVTTPESLYILLTSESGRNMLSRVRTVIVDEIHALAGNKRGAHLALSLERLERLCQKPPVRVGISATIKPIERIAEFLLGASEGRCEIIDEGHARQRDVDLELPPSPLEAVMSNEVWVEVYDRLAALVERHRTTLVFVNTRRLAERVARHLADRLGEEFVTSHHGSLAREHRLNAEQRLKGGKLKALVATASLELGIDIGDVDLVCQLGSPHAIAALLQRVGRSGHGLERVPKGRLFPLSRDELVECVALIDSVRRGELDAVEHCRAPLDVLAQQIVAEVSMQEWPVDALFQQFCRAANYRELPRETFDAVVDMLADGFTTQRGRRSAHLHYDRVNGIVRGRRGARLLSITNGGAIPDQFDYDVVLLPNEFPVGSLNEDFAFESLPGNIFQLGNTSYRILKIGSGKVYVEDAKGQPPNIPFWFGEAPGRSDELSDAVSSLRDRLDAALERADADNVSAQIAADMMLSDSAARQLVEYLATAKAALGQLPTKDRIIFERFFDEAGDTHLVVHSPLGSRINRAWGLSLRKRFCRRFNFELQAAALEDSIVLSLGAVHSFALDEVVKYLSSKTVRDVLSQAVLGAPIFPTYWRWNATIALAVRRFRNGKKAPAQFQRIDAEDLLSTVFPEQLACAENLGGGDREIPDHPLVTQTLNDCLHSAMDIDGLTDLLAKIEAGQVVVECRELASPSPLAQEILAAKAYAFLDDAPAEERRTLAVQSRRYMSVDQAADLGKLDMAAIERVRSEAWPDARNADELHDALVVCGYLTSDELDATPVWSDYMRTLEAERRATSIEVPQGPIVWAASERLSEHLLLFPEAALGADRVRPLPSAVGSAAEALRELLRGRLECLGPVTAATLAASLGVDDSAVQAALLALEHEGSAMRGAYSATGVDEWCDRRLLARIHRYTLKRLRNEIEPATLAEYQRFVFLWQGLGAERREGSAGLAAVLTELQGLAMPAAVWERTVLPARVADYGGDLLDALCVAGEWVWWRPRPKGAAPAGAATTIAASPVALAPRGSVGEWQSLEADAADPAHIAHCSSQARRVLDVLIERGASFFQELADGSGLLRTQVERALAELVGRGLVTADSFNGLRALLTPERRRRHRLRRRPIASRFDSAGRWALLPGRASTADERGGRRAAVELAALAILRRYGVVARAIVARESLAPSWRELLECYRRFEARGEIRGGRFIAPLGGEQFALTDAVSQLRRVRRQGPQDDWLLISAVDPANLVALVGQSRKIPITGGNRLAYRDGQAVAAQIGGEIEFLAPLSASERVRVQALLLPPRQLSQHLSAVVGGGGEAPESPV